MPEKSKPSPIVTCPSDTDFTGGYVTFRVINVVWCSALSHCSIIIPRLRWTMTLTMTDSSLLPISRGTAGSENNNSDSSVQTYANGTSEMNGSRKVGGNRTHRGMKSRHLTMIGMYPNYCDYCQYRLNLLSPSYWWYHRYRNILECRNRALIALTFIWSWHLSHQGGIDRRSCKCTSFLLCSRRIRLQCYDFSVS